MISCASLSWDMLLTTDTVSSKFIVSIYVRLRTFWMPLVFLLHIWNILSLTHFYISHGTIAVLCWPNQPMLSMYRMVRHIHVSAPHGGSTCYGEKRSPVAKFRVMTTGVATSVSLTLKLGLSLVFHMSSDLRFIPTALMCTCPLHRYYENKISKENWSSQCYYRDQESLEQEKFFARITRKWSQYSEWERKLYSKLVIQIKLPWTKLIKNGLNRLSRLNMTLLSTELAMFIYYITAV